MTEFFGVSSLLLAFFYAIGIVRPYKNIRMDTNGYIIASISFLVAGAMLLILFKEDDGSLISDSTYTILPCNQLNDAHKDTERLKAWAKNTSRDNIDDNYAIYSCLLELNLDNLEYQKKFKFYSEKKNDLEKQERYRKNPETALQLKHYDGYIDGFGTVMILGRVKIYNDAGFNIKDVTIKCTHYAPSGTIIDSNERTIYEIFPAGKRKTIRNFNMGFIHNQASASSCEIVKAAKA